MKTIRQFLQTLLWPLRSRKVLVAVATGVSVYLTAAGYPASPEVIYSLLGVGISLILGIAIEDAAWKGPK